MMIDVRMRDGRTTFRFAGRGGLVKLIKRNPAELDQAHPLKVWVDRGEGQGFVAIKMQFLSRSSIAWVEHVDIEKRDEFLREFDLGLLEHIQGKERARLARAAQHAEELPVQPVAIPEPAIA